MTAPPLEFTAAGPGDIPLLVALAGRIWRAHYPAIIGPESTGRLLARMYEPELMRREMIDLEVRWELARLADEPIGYLSWAHEPAAASVKLSKLYLDPARHGQGLGSAMLAHVETAARALGARRLYLFTHKCNVKALRAYERNGFVIEADVVTRFDDGVVMDDWRLAKALPPA